MSKRFASIVCGTLLLMGLVGFIGKWDWGRFQAEFELRSGCDDLLSQERNFYCLIGDTIDVLTDRPSFDRLLARAFFYRAMFDCIILVLPSFENIDDFSEAIRLDPSYARAYAVRGIATSTLYFCAMPPNLRGKYESLHYEKRIESDLRKAIELDPHQKHCCSTYSFLAQHLAGFKQEQSALKVCDAGIANISADEASCLYGIRASIYAQTGHHELEIENENIAKSLDVRFAPSGAECLYGKIHRVLAIWFLPILFTLWLLRARRFTPNPLL